MIPMPLPVQKVSQMFQRRALTGSMFWYLTVTTLSPCSPSALEDDDEDEGHTVVATARGVFNCNGGVLSSIETGVSIIIPQGAIPEGVEQEIYFKVCRDNSILPPLDKEKGQTWVHGTQELEDFTWGHSPSFILVLRYSIPQF